MYEYEYVCLFALKTTTTAESSKILVLDQNQNMNYVYDHDYDYEMSNLPKIPKILKSYYASFCICVYEANNNYFNDSVPLHVQKRHARLLMTSHNNT
jgi:hypothetical protein